MRLARDFSSWTGVNGSPASNVTSRRTTAAETYPQLAEILAECADREEEVFRGLQARIGKRSTRLRS